MTATGETAVAIPKRLFDQVEILARQLDISPSFLVGIAMENFLEGHASQAHLDQADKVHDDQSAPNQSAPKRQSVNQGDVYWIQSHEPNRSELGYYSHPYVVVQDDLFNHSRINSLVVCALTSNIRLANEPGNVLLDIGEADLPKQSAVIVSKISSVDRSQLGEYVGSLDQRRVDQILAGMRFLQLSFFNR